MACLPMRRINISNFSQTIQIYVNNRLKVDHHSTSTKNTPYRTFYLFLYTAYKNLFAIIKTYNPFFLLTPLYLMTSLLCQRVRIHHLFIYYYYFLFSFSIHTVLIHFNSVSRFFNVQTHVLVLSSKMNINYSYLLCAQTHIAHPHSRCYRYTQVYIIQNSDKGLYNFSNYFILFVI